MFLINHATYKKVTFTFQQDSIIYIALIPSENWVECKIIENMNEWGREREKKLVNGKERTSSTFDCLFCANYITWKIHWWIEAYLLLTITNWSNYNRVHWFQCCIEFRLIIFSHFPFINNKIIFDWNRKRNQRQCKDNAMQWKCEQLLCSIRKKAI